jgi:hypothetical protein
MVETMKLPRKALPEVAAFQAFLGGRIWGFANTVSNWQHPGHFPERRIRSDRRRDQFRAPRRDSVTVFGT